MLLIYYFPFTNSTSVFWDTSGMLTCLLNHSVHGTVIVAVQT